jgi:hypothetical protein
MTPTDRYFKIAARIWEAYFETRAGRRFGEEALSMKKRDELLEELRIKIKFKESKLNDKELMKKIEEARAKSLAASINNAFKK